MNSKTLISLSSKNSLKAKRNRNQLYKQEQNYWDNALDDIYGKQRKIRKFYKTNKKFQFTNFSASEKNNLNYLRQQGYRRKSCQCNLCGQKGKKEQYIDQLLPFHEPFNTQHTINVYKKKEYFQKKKVRMNSQRQILVKSKKLLLTIYLQTKKQSVVNISSINKFSKFNSAAIIQPKPEQQQESPTIQPKPQQLQESPTIKSIKKSSKESITSSENSLLKISRNFSPDKIIEVKNNSILQKRGNQQNNNKTQQNSQKKIQELNSKVGKERKQRKRFKTTIIQKPKSVEQQLNGIIKVQKLDEQTQKKLKEIIKHKSIFKTHKKAKDDFYFIEEEQKSRFSFHLGSEERQPKRKNSGKKISWTGKSKDESAKIVALFSSNKQQFQRRSSINSDNFNNQQQNKPVRIPEENPIKSESSEETNSINQISMTSIEARERIIQEKINKENQYKKILKNNRKTFESLVQRDSLQRRKIIDTIIAKKKIMSTNTPFIFSRKTSQHEKTKIEKIYSEHITKNLNSMTTRSQIKVNRKIFYSPSSFNNSPKLLDSPYSKKKCFRIKYFKHVT